MTIELLFRRAALAVMIEGTGDRRTFVSMAVGPGIGELAISDIPHIITR